MIVTVVCDVLGEENNGTTVAAMNLIRSLKAKGHEVRVLCADASREGEDGFYIVPTLNLGPFNGYVRRVGVTLAKPDKQKIAEAVDGADIVHCMLPFCLGSKAMRCAKGMGIPVTAGFHCQAENITAHVGMNKFGLLSRHIYWFLWRHFYRHVNAIHYPSTFIREIFESRIRKDTPGYVISNGVNPHVRRRTVEKPVALRDKVVIMTTGRYSREKAQEILLKAVRYSRHADEIQLILAGQGIREPYFRMLGRRLKNPPIFRFYPRDEIVDVLNMCDLYVHTAEMELEGIACLEAIACGKMTIVSDAKLSATHLFAIDESCVFHAGKPKDLARVIDDWIEHPNRKAAYEQQYLESSHAYDQSYCMDRMEDMLKEVAHAE